MHMLRSGRRVSRDRHDGIDHQLTRTVIGHVTTPVGLLKRGSDGSRIGEHVRSVGMHAQRVHVGMLEHQQVVVLGPRGQCVLERERLVVGNGPQGADAQHVMR
jgi:hypothetical protein